MKQEKEKYNHEIETLRKLNKIQIQAVPNKEKEIRRLTALNEKEKERAELMKSQVKELQGENKNMNEMNRVIIKTNHQELVRTMEKEKRMKQILVTDHTTMKMEIQKLTSEIRQEQNEQKQRSKEIERLKTEIFKIKSEQEKLKKQVSTEQNNNKKKLIEISIEKTNLEKQVITLKHFNIQLEKQIMSSKEQTAKENNVGTGIGQEDKTP